MKATAPSLRLELHQVSPARKKPQAPVQTSAPRIELIPSKADEARPYQQSYFELDAMGRTQAHLMSLEGWQLLMRVRDYLGWRYNAIVLAGTPFAPKPWRES